MQLGEAYAKIKALKQPFFQTRDIVVLLNLTTTATSKILSRLAKQGHLAQLRYGLWALPEKIEPFMLPEPLTAPFPSYISLQSALHYHGMIEQIPETIYAVSLARTKVFKTPLATVSVHHIPTTFYFGYTVVANNIKIAIPEKALLDFLYLRPAKSRLFTTLPELEIPKTFNHKLCREWLNKIPAPQRRTMVEQQLDKILKIVIRRDRF